MTLDNTFKDMINVSEEEQQRILEEAEPYVDKYNEGRPALLAWTPVRCIKCGIDFFKNNKFYWGPTIAMRIKLDKIQIPCAMPNTDWGKYGVAICPTCDSTRYETTVIKELDNGWKIVTKKEIE